MALEACKAIHRIECGRRIGIHIPRIAPKRLVEIHFHQSARRVAIIGQLNLPQGNPCPFQRGSQQRYLRCFAAAIQPLYHQ